MLWVCLASSLSLFFFFDFFCAWMRNGVYIFSHSNVKLWIWINIECYGLLIYLLVSRGKISVLLLPYSFTPGIREDRWSETIFRRYLPDSGPSSIKETRSILGQVFPFMIKPENHENWRGSCCHWILLQSVYIWKIPSLTVSTQLGL